MNFEKRKKYVETFQKKYPYLVEFINFIDLLFDDTKTPEIAVILPYIQSHIDWISFFLNLFVRLAEVKPKNRGFILEILKQIFPQIPEHFKNERFFEPCLCSLLADANLMKKGFVYVPNALTVYDKNSLQYWISIDSLDQLQAFQSANPEFDMHKKFVFDTYDPMRNVCFQQETNLIDIAAFYGSINCFKFLFMNNVEVTENTCEYAVCGGNIEIVRILEQKGLPFRCSLLHSIECHRDEITDWLLLNHPSEVEIEDYLGAFDFRGLLCAIKKISKKLLGEVLIECAEHGFLPLVKYLIEGVGVNKNYNNDEKTLRFLLPVNALIFMLLNIYLMNNMLIFNVLIFVV